jgi:hypothetical protein
MVRIMRPGDSIRAFFPNKKAAQPRGRLDKLREGLRAHSSLRRIDNRYNRCRNDVMNAAT